MSRRSFLSQLAAFPLVAFAGFDSASGAEAPASPGNKKPLNIMMKSAWGSDDPTKAAFPFLHGLALSEAGHSVQIFLLGEAVSRYCTAAVASTIASVVAIPTASVLLSLSQVSEKPHANVPAFGLT